MELKEVIANGWCVGCGMCAAVCAKYRLQMQWNDRGEYIPVERAGCNACGEACDLCVSVCPVHGYTKNETEIGESLYGNVPGTHYRDETGYYLGAYIGYTDRDKLRENGASGGMATWTLETLLESGEVDAVAAVGRTTNPEKFFEFRICNTVDEVRQCSRSAYYPVEVSEVIRHILHNEGRYAIIGLPCVCKAIRLAQERFPKLKQRIHYVLGLTCGNLCSKYYAEYVCALGNGDPHKIREFIFRTKHPNQPTSNFGFSFCSGDKTQEKLTQIFWEDGGNSGFSFFEIPGCFYCDDTFAECADATFMDAWLPVYSDQPEGNSIVLLRDSRLHESLAMAAEMGMPIENISIEKVIESQQCALKLKRQKMGVHIHRARKTNKPYPKRREELQRKMTLSLERRAVYYDKRIAEKAALCWRESNRQLSVFHHRMRRLLWSRSVMLLLKDFQTDPWFALKRIMNKLRKR